MHSKKWVLPPPRKLLVTVWYIIFHSIYCVHISKSCLILSCVFIRKWWNIHQSGQQPCLVSGACMWPFCWHLSETLFTAPFIYSSTSQQMFKCLLCASCHVRCSEYSCEPNRLSANPGDEIWATWMVGLTQFKKCIHQVPSPHQPL